MFRKRFLSVFHENMKSCLKQSYRTLQVATTNAKLNKVNNQEIELEKLKENDAGIAIINFNRPKARNAMSLNVLTKLGEIIQNVNTDNTIRVLILRSLVPNVFCAGADLKERATFTQKQVSNFIDLIQNIFLGIEQLPVPTVAAIDGLALGGGLEISLACDIRVTSKTAKLGLVETKLGIIPGAGGTQRLPRIIGPSIAKELIFTAKILNGQEAYNLGIVSHVLEQNESGDAAYQKSLEIAREILPNGPLAIKMAKQAINGGLQVDLNSGLVIEKACYAQLIPTKDRIEGFTAFNEKRKPNYIGE